MTIAEDPSTPQPTQQTAYITGVVVSNNFSPPANSLVVVMVNAMYFSGVSSATMTCADSLSNSYTAGPTFNNSAADSTVAIFTHYYTTAPGSINVTVTNSSKAGAAYFLAPRVVTGAASSQAGAGSASIGTYMAGDITTTASGSWVYVVAGSPEQQKQPAVSDTTTIAYWADSQTTDTSYVGRATNATVTPQATYLGWDDHGTWAALEILPAVAAPAISGAANVTLSAVAESGSGFFTTGTTAAIVQQVPGTSTYDYGWSTTQLTTSAGNTLVLIAGWNLNTTFSSAPMPAVYVLDDAMNRWHHVGTTSSSNTGSRCAVWVCSNAQPVSWISCSLTSFASSLAYTIIEVGNMSPYYSLDVVDTPSKTSDTTISSASLTAGAQDVAFTVLCVGSASTPITSAPSGWSALTGVTSGASGVNSVAIYPYYQQAVSKGASIKAAYTVKSSAPLSVVTFALVLKAYAPLQFTQNFPALKIEMAFGFQPGDPSQAPPTWVDVTNRCIANDGGTFIQSSMGRTYELTTQEAGTLTIGIDNHDGAFTPGNINSPYYPDVVVGTPVRVMAFWSGQTTEFWDFEDATTESWGASSSLTGATIALSGAWSETGFTSLQITSSGTNPNGQWYAHSPMTAVNPLVSVTASAWVYTPASLTVHVNIDYYDQNGQYISSSAGSSVSTSTGSVNELTASGTSPGNAASCRVSVLSASSPLGTVMYADTITLNVYNYGPGNWYHIGYGYVERWPQEWPDMPQWGLSSMVATDVFGVLSNSVLMEALDGDMLLDGPYVYIPGSEQYSTLTNGIDPAYTASEAQGLLAANYSRVNQQSGMYVDGTVAQVATGSSTVMLGDASTGFGTTAISTVPTAPTSGPGMIYQDPSLPSPATSAYGITVEFWVSINANVASSTLQPTIFTAYGPPSNFEVTAPSLSLQILNLTGNNNLQVTFRDGSTVTATFSPSASTQQIAFTMTTTSFSLYVNGALSVSTTISSAQFSSWQAIMLGCSNYAYQNGKLVAGNFTAMALGIYNYVLPSERIVSHYTTGVTGQENSDATTRIAQLLSWAYLGVPRGGVYLFNGVLSDVQQGPAYALTGAHVADAINQVAANEQGLVYSAPDGSLRFLHRWSLFNETPQYTFGDNPSAGEIPYLGDQTFSYDNTYLYNVDSVTQSTGPTRGVTVQAYDFNSRSQYFERSALQINIQTMSNLDAYDIANWSIYRYSQPSVRVNTLTVDAASNPSSFFAVLQTSQGDAAIVNRRPIGGAPISATVIVQKVTHTIGPGIWRTQYEMSPYDAMSAIQTLGTGSTSVIGNNNLA